MKNKHVLEELQANCKERVQIENIETGNIS